MLTDKSGLLDAVRARFVHVDTFSDVVDNFDRLGGRGFRRHRPQRADRGRR